MELGTDPVVPLELNQGLLKNWSVFFSFFDSFYYICNIHVSIMTIVLLLRIIYQTDSILTYIFCYKKRVKDLFRVIGLLIPKGVAPDSRFQVPR